VIAANRPIVIIDEPQKIGAEKSLTALSNFNGLMMLRYSATHNLSLVSRSESFESQPVELG
jgi:type III restriction enzyme